jgi:predicted dehydrogenase
LKPIGIGIIGCGLAGSLHATSYSSYTDPSKVKLIAACDANENAAKSMASEFKMDAYYTDVQKLLERKDIDAVSICLPHFLHADVTVAAAKAGKHVLCEKPMAITLEGCDRMIKAAKEAGVKLMIAENHRFLPAHTIIKQLVNEGRIGEIFLARAFEGVDGYMSLSKKNSWHFTWDKAGGGTLMDAGVHRCAVLRWLLGDVAFIRACWLEKQMIKLEDREEDNAMMLMKFKSGAMAEVVVSDTVVSPPSNRLELYGTEGTILEDHSWQKPVMVYSTKQGPWNHEWGTLEVEHEPYPGYYEISFRNEVQHFIDCILEDKEPQMSGNDGKAAIEMILMGYLCAKTGKVIERSDLYSAEARKYGIK